MRYEIHAVADETLSSLHPDVLAATDDIAEAQRLAAEHSDRTFGAGILDTVTGETDVGHGFGVIIADL